MWCIMRSGLFTSMLTPFRGDAVDEPRFAALVERQVAAEVDGLVVCARPGEGPSLTSEERRRIVRIAVDAVRGRMPVIAATGTGSTQKTIELTRAAEGEGASAVIVVTPYYTRPTQDGIRRHYEAIARAGKLPVVIENAPERTSIELAPETIARLAEVEAIVGFVDETRNHLRRLENALACGDRIRRFVPGDLAYLLFGPRPHGCISVAANIAPAFYRHVWQSRSRMDGGEADDTLKRAAELCRALGDEPEAATVKYALSRLIADFDPGVRLPLVGPTEQRRNLIEGAIAALPELAAER
jgi:4-hydroxy-tetrahydrodipicolinate synthase